MPQLPLCDHPVEVLQGNPHRLRLRLDRVDAGLREPLVDELHRALEVTRVVAELQHHETVELAQDELLDVVEVDLATFMKDVAGLIRANGKNTSVDVDELSV